MLAVLLAATTPHCGGQTIYFLLGEVPGHPTSRHESYVLPLSKPEDIAHARDLIARGQTGTNELIRSIVVARIARSRNDINRNYLDPKFPEWRWHVTEFVAFADFTAEVLDGYPSNMPALNTIGFWSYTVIRELGPTPLYLSLVARPGGFDVFRTGLGTNYIYRLETSPLVLGTNWLPVAGIEWSAGTNRWRINDPERSNAPQRFYRAVGQPAGIRASQSAQHRPRHVPADRLPESAATDARFPMAKEGAGPAGRRRAAGKRIWPTLVGRYRRTTGNTTTNHETHQGTLTQRGGPDGRGDVGGRGGQHSPLAIGCAAAKSLARVEPRGRGAADG